MWHVLIVVTTVSGVTAFGTTTARALGHLPCVGVETQIGNGHLCLSSTDSIRDCPDCPEMVVVPAGSFVMGSPEGEPMRESSEGPQHVVKIGKPFAVGRSAVTRAEFSAFVTDTGYAGGDGCYTSTTVGWKRHPGKSWRSPGIAQDDRHPVVCVSWEDARAFVDWLARRTGKRYRLLSEAEWEYVARAGTTTPFWWGLSISTSEANYDGRQSYAEGFTGEWRKTTVPARSFAVNPWGLYNVHGNVWEWVEDCWNDSYLGAPANESAWMTGDCASRVLRGGSWVDGPGLLRAASRFKYRSDYRDFDSGFRVARSLTLEVAAVSPSFEGYRPTIVARRH